MKILSPEEISSHNEQLVYGGAKGALLGGAFSTLLFTVGKRRYPAIGRLPTAFRTALKIAPPTFAASVNAELASIAFDRKMYSDDPRIAERHLSELKRWKALSFKDKTIETLSTHKYKIIVGAWAASMYGSWVFVDRDPIMTQSQKIVQARVYAQFLTVALLLASIGLNVYEEKHGSSGNQTNNIDNTWKDIIQDEENAEKARGETTSIAKNKTNDNEKENSKLQPKQPQHAEAAN